MREGAVVQTLFLTAAGTSPPQEELHLTAMLAQFGQGLQWPLIGQKLALGVPQSLNENVSPRLACREHRGS